MGKFLCLVVVCFSLGCATAGGAALGKCELGALPAELEPLIVAVQAIATNTASTVADLEALATGPVGESQLACVVEAIDTAAVKPAQSTPLRQAGETPRQHAHAVMQAWLAAHPQAVAACGTGK